MHLINYIALIILPLTLQQLQQMKIERNCTTRIYQLHSIRISLFCLRQVQKHSILRFQLESRLQGLKVKLMMVTAKLE